MGMKDFKVQGLLGKGAFGDVYRVTRRSDNKVYALKRVSIRSLSEREVADALNEIRFLASVRHRNVIGFLEAFLDQRNMHLCVVMELADGGDLAQVIADHKRRKRYIPEDDVWRYFVQICKGLAALHRLNILHRDLKSANCFLSREEVVKIGDFNVSRTLKKGLAHTQIGTPYYMSPEIWRNRPYDAKSDMWAAGVILYELCALRPPFRGRDMKELSKRVQSGAFARISPRYSSDLDAVIRRLLRVDPGQRPSAAEALELPQVAARRKQVQDALEGTAGAGGAQPPLLDTIAVPRNLSQITNNLPKACYPETRPNSPVSWPVGERRRREKLPAGGHGARGEGLPSGENQPGGWLPGMDPAHVHGAGVVGAAHPLEGRPPRSAARSLPTPPYARDLTPHFTDGRHPMRTALPRTLRTYRTLHTLRTYRTLHTASGRLAPGAKRPACRRSSTRSDQGRCCRRLSFTPGMRASSRAAAASHLAAQTIGGTVQWAGTAMRMAAAGRGGIARRGAGCSDTPPHRVQGRVGGGEGMKRGGDSTPGLARAGFSPSQRRASPLPARGTCRP